MNAVNLIGNLTRDPELRYSQNGTAIASCNIAVQRRFKNQNGEYESDFINIKAFSKTAELLAEHFRKGSKLGVTGNIQTGSYENQQGQRVYTTDVVVENLTFIERKTSDSGGFEQRQGNYSQTNQNANTSGSFSGRSIDISDDDLPF
ncbi:single-stranded DNA-binding protein [Enterococcus devriesei]|uniref:single-stranded DNA-binding protein n=1 Tax=Enterococcus devriesei TaxID=319970 RepID=UPI0028E745AA|nr:single-stranded DNA-binding protein [Enterococcus devriesei]